MFLDCLPLPSHISFVHPPISFASAAYVSSTPVIYFIAGLISDAGDAAKVLLDTQSC